MKKISQKEKVLTLLKSCPRLNSKQLAKLTGAPVRKIAAWKAHFTMGTYNQ